MLNVECKFFCSHFSPLEIPSRPTGVRNSVTLKRPEKMKIEMESEFA